MELSWNSFCSYSDKMRALLQRQRALLDLFLANGALTQSEYDTCIADLSKKMGIQA